MIGTLLTDKEGRVQTPQSAYQPTEQVKTITGRIKQDFELGYDNLNMPFRELGDMSVVSRMNKDQKLFQAYVEPLYDDPDDRWRHEGVRNITRNQLISIAAHVTASLLYPNTFAQNELDEEDRAAADLMRDLMKFNIRNSDYEVKYLLGVLGALSNPCVFLHPRFDEVMQSIKVRGENGEISVEEVVDETMSGLQLHVLPPNEVLIANPYDDRSNQFQRFNVRRRLVEYDEAEQLYGDQEDFEFVSPGVKHVFNAADSTFYALNESEGETLIEEVTYYNRLDDTEVTYVNGIYVGDTNTEENEFNHRDNQNKPKYPYVHFGYHSIPNFFYFKSAAFELENDQDLVDKMWRMTIDGTFLSVFQPLAASGTTGKVDASVIYPARVTGFREEGAKLTPIIPNLNLNAGYSALEKIEQNMAETSAQDPSRRGVRSEGVNTAFEQGIIERNARIQLGIFGKNIARAVVEMGLLMIDLILAHQTIGDIEEVTAGQVRMKYQKFLLPDEDGDGKQLTKRIEFTDELLGEELDDEERKDREFDLLDEAGGLSSDTAIIKANPELIRNLKFKLSVDADSILPKNEAFEKAMNLEAYDRMIVDPFVDHRKVSRDFLVKTFAKGETDEYMKDLKQLGLEQQQAQQAGQQGRGAPPNESGTSELVNQASGMGSLRNLLTAGG